MQIFSLTNGLADIRSWQERALSASFRVDKFAELAGEKPYKLRQESIRHFRMTLKRWLREERVREVKRRLLDNELLKNIAIDLGYGNSSNLARDFKGVCGISPRQWIKASRRGLS